MGFDPYFGSSESAPGTKTISIIEVTARLHCGSPNKESRHAKSSITSTIWLITIRMPNMEKSGYSRICRGRMPRRYMPMLLRGMTN